MMRSVNRVILVGHLGADPESKTAGSSAVRVCNLRVATTDRWRDKATGERKEATEWHRVVLYRRLAEIAAEYAHKGDLVYLAGSLHTRKWLDNHGTERSIIEIEATEFQILNAKQSNVSSAPSSVEPNGFSANVHRRTQTAVNTDLEDPDDIPF